MGEYDDLLIEAYRGEVLGAALFGAMADTEADHGRREQLAALRDVEAQTAGRLHALAETSGIDTGSDDSPRADGVAPRGGRSRRNPGTTSCAAFGARFRRTWRTSSDCQAIGAPGDPILVELVAHERAIDRFAELEVEGRSAEALAVLRGHLDTSPARPRVADARLERRRSRGDTLAVKVRMARPESRERARTRRRARLDRSCSGASPVPAGAAAAISVWLAFASDHVEEPAVSAALEVWMVLGYVLAGLVAWWRRPEPLRSADGRRGFGFFLSSLSWANVSACSSRSGSCSTWCRRCCSCTCSSRSRRAGWRSRFERVLVGVGYVTAFGLQLVAMALDGFGPDNLLAIVSEPDAAE